MEGGSREDKARISGEKGGETEMGGDMCADGERINGGKDG